MACGSAICSYPLDLPRSSERKPLGRTDGARHRIWLLALIAMHERWRQRQALMDLDDRLLADIGISRDELRAEVTKPFWR